jgi:phage shock protein PspC (stress-responsive transcriptional regulator)
MRVRNEQMIAGVCAGLAKYFGTDVTLVRLGFVLLTVLGVGATIPLYFILWVVLPAEGVTNQTTQQSLQSGLDEMKNQFQVAANKVKQGFQSQNRSVSAEHRFDPYTGQPINQPTVEEQKPRFDPYTGQPLDQ